MDVLVLGAMAMLLIGITVWLVVWPSRTTDSLVDGTAREKETTAMTPQGDEFEDQYTSATADLSAGGVATSFTGSPAPASEYQQAGEPWSSPTTAREGV